MPQQPAGQGSGHLSGHGQLSVLPLCCPVDGWSCKDLPPPVLMGVQLPRPWWGSRVQPVSPMPYTATWSTAPGSFLCTTRKGDHRDTCRPLSELHHLRPACRVPLKPSKPSARSRTERRAPGTPENLFLVTYESQAKVKTLESLFVPSKLDSFLTRKGSSAEVGGDSNPAILRTTSQGSVRSGICALSEGIL